MRAPKADLRCHAGSQSAGYGVYRAADAEARQAALELEGKLLAMGKPVTIYEVRAVLGTPRREDLIAAGTAANLAFLPVLVDPDQAGETRTAFSLQVEGDKTAWHIEMRNGVILIERATVPMSDHVELTAMISPSSSSAPAPDSLLAVLDARLTAAGSSSSPPPQPRFWTSLPRR